MVRALSCARQHKPVAIKPGISSLLRYLSDAGVPLAVATSSQRATVERKLELAQIDHHFQFAICGGETKRGKPDTDPYLKATSDSGIALHATWAIEDSDNGVWAAHRAGLTVFQIPDELEPSDEVRSLGHVILESAQQIYERIKLAMLVINLCTCSQSVVKPQELGPVFDYRYPRQ